jgi:hypothetical protein
MMRVFALVVMSAFASVVVSFWVIIAEANRTAQLDFAVIALSVFFTAILLGATAIVLIGIVAGPDAIVGLHGMWGRRKRIAAARRELLAAGRTPARKRRKG